MSSEAIERLLKDYPDDFRSIGVKVLNNKRLTDQEALFLFENASLSFAGTLANFVRQRLHGDKTFFNRNFHIEPTNV